MTLMKLRHCTATTVTGIVVAAQVAFRRAHYSLENVRKQRCLIAIFEHVPGRIKLHDKWHVAPLLVIAMRRADAAESEKR